MKKLLFFLLTVITLLSCEDVPDKSKLKAKVQRIELINSSDSIYAKVGGLVIRQVDTIFKAGDIVQLGDYKYQIQSTTAPTWIQGDYQLDVYKDSIIVWDADRRVGKLKCDSTQSLDKLIFNDN